MNQLSPFCTCKSTNCPHHPTNHDRGCSSCITKNLTNGEIPACFFNQVDETYKGPGFFYADFARLVMKKREKEKTQSHE